jgi:hypothetical protein
VHQSPGGIVRACQHEDHTEHLTESSAEHR